MKMGKKKQKKKQENQILSRKEKRKGSRKSRKQKKNQFFRKKFAQVKETQQDEGQHPHQEREKAEAGDDGQPQKSKMEKLKADQEAQRKKRLRLAILEEEKNLKKLEKKLNLNKNKSSGLPKAFVEDGLDFLLDVCKGVNAGNLDDEYMDENVDDRLDEEDLDEDVGDEEDLDEDVRDEEDLDEDGSNEIDEDVGDEDMDDESDEDDDDREDDEEMEQEKNDHGEEELHEEAKEDIYGVKRNAKGEIVPDPNRNKYVPPALRAKMVIGSKDDQEKRRIHLQRQTKKIKGLLNRLSSSNVGSIAREVEQSFNVSSKNDMNEILFSLYQESLLTHIRTPERLVMEHALLIGILHVNVGIEVGASMLQSTMTKFIDIYNQAISEDDKTLDNMINFILNMYVFKVYESELLFNLLEKFIEKFESKDIELIMLLLRQVGFNLRKDNAIKFKEVILSLQQTCRTNSSKYEGDSRIKFMMETLMAIKNNNVKKIPNYDSDHQQFLVKAMKQHLRRTTDERLKVVLADLLNADTRGKWWIVGSAWTGKEGAKSTSDTSMAADMGHSYSSELLELARKMRMNTDVRRSIFCTVMSAEDYVDAFEKLLKLSIKSQKEREMAFVLLDCCLQEKKFNPYYSELMIKLAKFDRKYRMACQYAIWDRVKEIASLQKFQVNNLANFSFRMISSGALTLTSLKVIEFADLNKHNAAFLKIVMKNLLQLPYDDITKVFGIMGSSSDPNIKFLRDSFTLFMRQFVLKDKKSSLNYENLKENIKLAEVAMNSE